MSSHSTQEATSHLLGDTNIGTITASSLVKSDKMVFVLAASNRKNSGQDHYWIKVYWDDCYYGYAS